MKGTLHKTDKGWVVNYRDNGIRDGMSLNYHKAAQYPLHPDETNMDVLNPSPEGKEVEFEIIRLENPPPQPVFNSIDTYARIIEKPVTHQVVKDAMNAISKDVRAPKAVRDGLVSPPKSWDDIMKESGSWDDSEILAYIIKNYHPPKKK